MRSAILSSSFFSVLSLLGSSQNAQATIIEDLIGDVAFAPVSVTLDTPDAATNINGVVHVVGQHDGKAARQLIDLTTGTVGQVEFFDSLLSAQGNGGNQTGMIRGVQQLNDGSVLYVGDSAGNLSMVQPTYWTTQNNPDTFFSSGQEAAGFLYASAADGTTVGNIGVPVYASPGGSFTQLPGFGAVRADDISVDARYIVGSSVWVANGTGGYAFFDTSTFDLSVSGGLPEWRAVAIDPVIGDAVFAGSYFDLNTFSENVGFWRADGSFIGASVNGSLFRDFEVWEGQLVAAVSSFGVGYLHAISDFSTIALSSILGVDADIYDDGLFVGSAGFLSSGANGAFITTRTTHDPFGGGTEVPEPATCTLVAMALAFAVRKRSIS